MKAKPEPKIPDAPEGLSEGAASLWRDVLGSYEFEAHHLRTFEVGLRQLDRAADARLVDTAGLTIVDRFGQTKSHPAVEIERSASLAFLRIMRELGLDISPPETRGPRLRGDMLTMPPVKKIYRGKRQITLADLSIAELLILDCGPCRGWGEILTGLDVAREVYSEFGDELGAAFVARSPGCRPWCAWTFGLLPSDPRQLAAHDPELPSTSTEPPSGEPWHSSDGYESSHRYLSRRGLLGVNELASIRAKYSAADILESHRQQLERIEPQYRDNARMPGWELADLLSLFPDTVMLADERRRAEPYILS